MRNSEQLSRSPGIGFGDLASSSTNDCSIRLEKRPWTLVLDLRTPRKPAICGLVLISHTHHWSISPPRRTSLPPSAIIIICSASPALSAALPRGIRVVESNELFDVNPDVPDESQLFHIDYYSLPNVYVIVLLRETTPEHGPWTF